MTSEALAKIYYDTNHPASFASKEKLFEAARIENQGLKSVEVEKWLKKQLTYTLHRPIKMYFERNPVVAKHPNDQFQADLADLRTYAKHNDGYKYILTVIHVFSKFAFATPIKSRTPKDICAAFKTVFKFSAPQKLQTDQRKEFLNNMFKKMCEEYRIIHFISKDGEIKCAVVERFNRTLKSKMFMFFTYKGSRRYIDVLQNLLNSYNNTIHRSTGMKPVAISSSNSNLVFKRLCGHSNFRKLLKQRKKKSNVMEGDKVRIKYARKPFHEGNYPNWTDAFEEVANVIKGDIKPYVTINNISERFYPEEIQKIIPELHRIEKIIKRRKRKITPENSSARTAV